MVNKLWYLLALFLIVVTTSGCHFAVRALGGTTEVTLPSNKKLVNVTWKEGSLWYLLRDRHETETAETYEFVENSNFGAMQGTVIIHEQ